MKVRIQARKDMWRDIAEYLFAAYHEITLYFKPDMIIARDLTPDHVMLYDVRIKKDFFHGYKFEVVEDKEPVVFAVDKRDFLRAVREAKTDWPELVYDEKSGKLKLDDFTVGQRDDSRKGAVTLPDPRVEFVNEAVIEDIRLFQEFLSLRRYLGKYAPNIIVTFAWEGARLKVRFWDEKGNFIAEFPGKPIKVERYRKSFAYSYTVMFDIPTRYGGSLIVEMSEDGVMRLSIGGGYIWFTLYIAPRVKEGVPQLPEFIEHATIQVELTKYFLRFLHRKDITDNVLMTEKHMLKFIGINIAHNMLVVMEIEPEYVDLTKEVVLEHENSELAERLCELLGEAVIGVDGDGNVWFCNVKFGKIARPEDVNHLKDLLKDLNTAYEKNYGRYAHITVRGGKLAKALEKAEKLRAIVWHDLVEVEIDGTKWGKPDLEEVSYPGMMAAVSVDAEIVPIIPLMTLVSGVPVRISFNGWNPAVVSYGLLKGVTGPKLKVTGYLSIDVDDLAGWLGAKGLLKPPSDLDVLLLVKEMPGATSTEIARELLFRGFINRDTLTILERLKARGFVREENYKYYPVEKAPPPVEAEREKALKDVERLKEEISKARPEAERLSKDVGEVLEHLSPFVKTAKGYLEQFDKIGRLPDAEFDKRIGEVEKLVADAEAFLRKYREDRALVRLDERLSNMKKKLEELKAKVDEFGRRAEELRGRLAKLGLSPSMAEAKPLDLATLGELVVEKIPYRLDAIDKDLWLIEVTLKASIEQTERRLEERRKPRPAVPKELEEYMASIRSELDKFKKEYVSYMSDVEAYNLAFNKHMAALREIREKLGKPKYYSETVLREFREAIEKARKWSEEAAPKEVKLRDRQSELLRKAQRI
ncbi:MAG: hypothetical protein LM558_04310, partial [Thermosphaera sp.]|nr:hypothetical protein [Thermosphaera sp.]